MQSGRQPAAGRIQGKCVFTHRDVDPKHEWQIKMDICTVHVCWITTYSWNMNNVDRKDTSSGPSSMDPICRWCHVGNKSNLSQHWNVNYNGPNLYGLRLFDLTRCDEGYISCTSFLLHLVCVIGLLQ
jgi:hypothetical protein